MILEGPMQNGLLIVGLIASICTIIQFCAWVCKTSVAISVERENRCVLGEQ